MWNKQSIKPILERKEKTYQQSKHLENLVRSRSALDLTEPWRKTSSISTERTKKSIFQRDKINYQNRVLLTKIAQINQKENVLFPKTNKFTMLSQSLSNIVTNNRIRNLKSIGKQNQSIYHRLVSTSPSIKQQMWRKSMENQLKYRNNLLKNRVHNPDYTVLASSFISKKYKDQMMNSPKSIAADTISTKISKHSHKLFKIGKPKRV